MRPDTAVGDIDDGLESHREIQIEAVRTLTAAPTVAKRHRPTPVGSELHF
jgi:hypothetical protein